ncbi:MAG TPA: F0F1 ATP synthase subunit epsilon [Nitrospiria bacterium]|jgi:F-type H+-transporting ATPase subunit epsilon|nr:F0F1 ATP synthase subunit epsilon [Nitrospiria bacterium]
MRPFILHLQSATQFQRIEGVTSFVGEDRSGQFGILAGHARMITSLAFGLARYRTVENVWNYLALPGALLYFVDDRLAINTRRYLIDTDYQRISSALEEQLGMEEEKLRGMKESLHRLEAEMFKRLQRMERGEEGSP